MTSPTVSGKDTWYYTEIKNKCKRKSDFFLLFINLNNKTRYFARQNAKWYFLILQISDAFWIILNLNHLIFVGEFVWLRSILDIEEKNKKLSLWLMIKKRAALAAGKVIETNIKRRIDKTLIRRGRSPIGMENLDVLKRKKTNRFSFMP